ncbi:MAG TPA: VOC family protein [Friedmanniella sp.]
MDRVSWTHVVLDGSLSDAAATFWAEALDGSWRAASPDPSLAASLVRRGGDTYLHRAAPGTVAPDLVLEVDDVVASTQRLLALGATGPTADSGELRSPGGLSFGLTQAHEHRRAPAARRADGTSSRLVQVCLDCPPERAGAEAEFWRAATGWAREDCLSPEFLCHLVPDAGPVQLLVQRRESALPAEVTPHLDLGTSDHEAEAARLLALGATRVATGRGWVVLADPDGRTFCATGLSPEVP